MNALLSLSQKIHDLTNTHYPYYVLLAREILKYHRFPKFNPFIFGGQPLWGDPQNGIFYPFSYFYLFLNFDLATMVILITHALIAAGGTFLVFNHFFKLNRRVAIALSFFWVFYPKWFYHLAAGHLSLIECFAWFPIIFYYILLTIKPNFQFKPMKLFALISVSSMAIFANYFFFYQMVVFFSAFYFFWLIVTKANKVFFLFRIIKFLILGSLGIFAVTAIQIIPGLIALPRLTRYSLSAVNVLPFWGWKYFLISLVFPFYNLASYNQEAFLYGGILFFGLAIFSAVRTKEKIKQVLLPLAVFCLLITLNFKTPFFGLLIKILPGGFSLRVTSRFFFFVYYILLIFLGFWLKNKKKEVVIAIFILIIAEYLFLDLYKLTHLSEDKINFQSKIYTFLKKNYPAKKIYATGYFLSEYELAKYNIIQLGGENPWQFAEYIEKLKQAGNYSWFQDYAVIYPPYVAEEKQTQPDPQRLCSLGGEIILSKYPLTNSKFTIKAEIDKIKIYENSCSQF